MSREDFIVKLEAAAETIADMPRHELQVLLRRAALRLRNLPVQGSTDKAGSMAREFFDDIGCKR